jgi:hypothetical protein
LGPILDILRLNINVTPDDARLVLMGVILLLFLLYKPAGLIPERRSDNDRYLKLLTKEERQRSDDSVYVRQSVTEQERLGNNNNENGQEISKLKSNKSSEGGTENE